MFDATEPAALARQLFGPPGQEFARYFSRRKRAKRRFDEALLSNLHALWSVGDSGYQAAILTCVVSLTPHDGVDLVWSGLTSSNGILQSIAVAAQSSYVHRQVQVSTAQIDSLVQLAEAGDKFARISALEFLEILKHEAVDKLLDQFRNGPSAPLRFRANLKLLQRGENVTSQLFADLDRSGYVHWGEEDLWRNRHLLRMTPAQDALLAQRMRHQMTRLRRDCRRYEDPPALSLYYFLREGMPQSRGDVDRIAEAIFRTTPARQQRDLVEAVAWFANDRARDWLQAICDSETLPKTVRNAAKRELRKLNQPAP